MTTADLHILSQHHLMLAALLARYRPHLIIAGICLLAGTLLWTFDFTDTEAFTLWAGLIMGIGLVWLVPAFVAYLRSIRKVSVFEEGLSWSTVARSEFHPWDELREVYRSETLLSLFQRQAEIKLVFKQAAPVVFDQRLSDFFQLATLIEATVTQRLLPAYRQWLAEGSAAFGPVVLKPQVIGINGVELSWPEVQAWDVRAGGLVVFPLEVGAVEEFASFATIPNYLILLQLLEEQKQLKSQ